MTDIVRYQAGGVMSTADDGCWVRFVVYEELLKAHEALLAPKTAIDICSFCGVPQTDIIIRPMVYLPQDAGMCGGCALRGLQLALQDLRKKTEELNALKEKTI
jgi:hypothetical protein